MSGLSFIKSINVGNKNEKLLSKNINTYLSRNSTKTKASQSDRESSKFETSLLNKTYGESLSRLSQAHEEQRKHDSITQYSNIITSINQNNNNAQTIETITATTSRKSVEASKQVKQAKCYKNVLKYMFSNVGLIIVLFSYTSVGALMFQLLEQHEEMRLCEGELIFIRIIFYINVH